MNRIFELGGGEGLVDATGTLIQEAGSQGQGVTPKLDEGQTNVAPPLTSTFGIPMGDISHSYSINGHPVTSDVFMMEKQQAFNRAKIVERAVHACGSGALGYFQVTNDVSRYCKADFLSTVGKRTPLIGRFSTVTYGREFPDSARNPRGLAFKFYTGEGNYDVLCINFPVFFVREPSQGPDVIRSQQRNPQNFLVNYDAMFDFMSLVPESMLANTYFWSDHGHPYGWRFMDGFPCHTFRWVNALGEPFYVKYTFKSDQGIKNFTFDQAVAMCGRDPDFAKRDLWQTINDGGQASWTWYIQVMKDKDALTYKWDPFDNTKTWPVEDYPLIEVGKLVFDKNPENFHRDIEQLAFSPGRMVPGIEPSPDPLLQFRTFFYNDAQLYRLGVNYHQIPVNCPFMAKHNHPVTRDGLLRVDTNGGAEPHYFPNSVSAPLGAKPDLAYNWVRESVHGVLGRQSTCKHEASPQDDYIQVNLFYNSLSPTDRMNLHRNIAGELVLVSRADIQYRFLVSCYKADPAYARGIVEEMEKVLAGLTKTEIPEASASTQIAMASARKLLPLPSLDKIAKLAATYPFVVDRAAGYAPTFSVEGATTVSTMKQQLPLQQQEKLQEKGKETAKKREQAHETIKPI